MLRIFPQRRLMLAAMALFLAAASSEAASQVITGTALYRERLALPPGAVFEATLEDISRADALLKSWAQRVWNRQASRPSVLRSVTIETASSLTTAMRCGLV